MKTKRSFTIVVVLTAVLAIAATGAVAWAGLKECGLIGTWSGYADQPWPNSSIAWLAVQTAGSTDARNGEMLLNWVEINSDLLTLHGGYPAVTLTPGHGVWHWIGKSHKKDQYNYTWYTYGIGDSGIPVYSVQVTGVATMTDCNDVSITYTYEVFDGLVAPQDMSQYTPIYSTTGTAAETRVPLVTP